MRFEEIHSSVLVGKRILIQIHKFMIYLQQILIHVRYDEGLMIWNGENYELCIKLWLCAGGLYQVRRLFK
jgi:hypothetical protein